MFSLNWQDIMAILDHCCTPNEKEPILRKAREHINGLQDTHPHHQIDQMGGDATPEHDPHWDCEDPIGQARVRHITCLSEGMKKFMVKL